jgi:hypothetical protein
MVSFLDKQIAMQRKRVIRDLLNDTCTITPVDGANMTVNSDGIPTSDAPVAKTWVNPFIDGFVATTLIPCRVDPSRSQQPDRMKVQTVVVDQYYLELPFNVMVSPTDVVTIIDRYNVPHRYEIVKLDLQGAMSLTILALITEINVGLDNA